MAIVKSISHGYALGFIRIARSAGTRVQRGQLQSGWGCAVRRQRITAAASDAACSKLARAGAELDDCIVGRDLDDMPLRAEQHPALEAMERPARIFA
jgi:hypothetical protein